MKVQENMDFIDYLWEKSILPTLCEYIRIPNKSPLFDPQWQQHGYMAQAVKLLFDWCLQYKSNIPDMVVEIVQPHNRTPLILIEVPGSIDKTILMYGHLDKQPEMTGWDEDLNPWQPVIKNNKLYGRGGADDGYAIFASLGAILSLKSQCLPHARCVIMIEASEESGSPDLPYYMDSLETRIGSPDLIICLDSGCGNYEQLWVSTSLRGMMGGILKVDVLKKGIHSGLGSGIVPSSHMITRQLLNRIEDSNTGEILLKDLYVDIPIQRIHQAQETSEVLGKEVYLSCGLLSGVNSLTENIKELLLNRTWRPTLSYIGCDGLPACANAGNVSLPFLNSKLSLRLPPTSDAIKAANIVKDTLEASPPFNAKVEFEITETGSGWNAPVEKPWLTKALNEVSQHYFSTKAMYMGEGGSIPFMGMLGKKFPEAQFVITGVLGPESNAHGPNEFLHIPMAKKLTACIAEIINLHYKNLN